jgi:hypothetical protein
LHNMDNMNTHYSNMKMNHMNGNTHNTKQQMGNNVRHRYYT